MRWNHTGKEGGIPMWKEEEAGGGGEGEWERERWVEDRGSLLKNGPTLPDEVAFVGKDVEFKGVITSPRVLYFFFHLFLTHGVIY